MLQGLEVRAQRKIIQLPLNGHGESRGWLRDKCDVMRYEKTTLNILAF